MDSEIWKPIPEHGDYEVSNLGRIRSWKPWRDTPLPRLLKPYGKADYPRVSLGWKRQHLLHVLVLETFVGPCPEGMEACHRDGDKRNPRLDNLRWDTRPANYSDRMLHKVDNAGTRNGQAKLNDRAVRRMRRMRKSGVTYQRIADQFGVAIATAHVAINRGWQHVN